MKTVWANKIAKRMVASLLAVVLVMSMAPASLSSEAAGGSEVTVTGLGDYGVQSNLSRWLFRLKLSTPLTTAGDFAVQGTDLGIEVDDGTNKTFVNVPSFAATSGEASGQIGFIVPFDNVPENPVGYRITIKAGSFSCGSETVNITNDYSIRFVEGTTWEYTSEQSSSVVTVTPAYSTQNDTNGSQYGFYFTTDADDPLVVDSTWASSYKPTQGGLYFGGKLNSNVPIKKIGDKLYFAAIDEWEPLVKGTEVKLEGVFSDGANSVKFNAITFVYGGNKNWTVKTADEGEGGDEGESGEVNTTTVNAQHNYRNSEGNCTGGLYFSTDVDDSLESDVVNWSKDYEAITGGVYVNDNLEASIKVKKVTTKLYYIPLSDYGITPAQGMKILIDGTFGTDTIQVKVNPCTFVYDGNGNWEVDSSITVAATVAIDTDGRNSAGDCKGGFYFVVDPADPLAYDTDNWTINYEALEGGIYVEDELKSNVQLKKITQRLYYVPLSDFGIAVTDGMKVKIDGTFGSASQAVKYLPATFEYQGNGMWKLAGGVEEEWSQEPMTVYDLYDLLSVSAVTIPADCYYNLADLKKSVNVGVKMHVAAYTPENNIQDFAFGLSKDVANNIWVESGYQIKIVPQIGRVMLLTEADTLAVIVDGHEAVKNGDFDLEYGVVNMRDTAGELVARKVYVKINDIELITYYDKALDRELGTYIPAYAYEGLSVTVESCSQKGYALVDKTATVQDITELIGGINSMKAVPAAVTYIGEMKKSENIALRTEVVVKDFTTYEEGHYDEFKIGIGQTDKNTIWDLDKSGYEVWFRPGAVYIGIGDTELAAMTSCDLPGKFTLEFGTYNIEIHKNGKKTGDYGRMVYVKIDGKEVLSYLDKDFNRKLGKHAMVYSTDTVDVKLNSLTSDLYLIREGNIVSDLYDASGLSEVKLNRYALTKLGTLPEKTEVALRMKVKLNTDADEVKFAISKVVNDNFWDLEKSGWEFWFRPEAGQIFIGYEHDLYGAVVGYQFSKNFVLEIGQRNVKYNTGKQYGREVYVKIDGAEVISWIDTNYDRPLGTYVSAWASQDANVTLKSLTTKGYVPVDKVPVSVDIFDASQYATVDLVKNECLNIGQMKDFKNKSIKMKVKVNKDASEFKIATAKVSDSTIWDIEESGWQFWFRPSAGQVFIGYGVSEYAEVIGHQYKEEFELEIGTREVYFKNGKYYGLRVFITIDGEEVISWIDTDGERKLGENIIAYAAGDADVTISSLKTVTELPITYIVNGKEKKNCDLIQAKAMVALGEDSKVNVTLLRDPKRSVDYKGFFVNGEVLKPVNELDETYIYLLKAPKANDELVIELNLQALTVDSAEVVDFYDVTGKESVTVKAHEDAALGNAMKEDGNPHKVNSAMRFIVDLPNSFNTVRVAYLGDWTSIWGYSGALFTIVNGKGLIQYTASQGTLAQGQSKLFVGGNSVVMEVGIVKCYEDGIYRYDRYYMKAGETADSMELVTWYDSTSRGGYGSGVLARGTDIDGSDFTLRSLKSIYTITDVSDKKEKEKLASYDAIGETRYEVYYPESVVGKSSAEIKLYVKAGMKLDALYVNGQKVKAKQAEDGAYVYTIDSVTKDTTFKYTIKKGV